jgi:hypothetical protein
MGDATSFGDKFQFKTRIHPNKRNAFTNRSTIRQEQRSRTITTAALPPPPTTTTSAPSLPDDFDTTNLPRILENRTLFIHSKVPDLVKLTQIAEGLGATVRTDMSKSVTHVVIEPRGDRRQLAIVKSAVSKGIICVSSKWLLVCYTQKRYCPTIAYQYDIHESSHMFDLPDQQEDFNPFGTTYIDYDALEAKKPKNGGQLSMDGFVLGTRQLSITKQSQGITPTGNSQSNTFDTALTRGSSVEPEVIDEYYYNNSDDASPIYTLVESAEEVEAKRIQSEQAVKEARQLLEERKRLLEEEERKKGPPQQKKKSFIPNIIYGEKRLKIWYGPQSLQDELLSRKK